MELNQALVDSLKGPIESVWNYMGCDLCALDGEITNKIAIECCIDADHLATQGFKEAQAIIDELTKSEVTVKQFINFLSKHIRLI